MLTLFLWRNAMNDKVTHCNGKSRAFLCVCAYVEVLFAYLLNFISFYLPTHCSFFSIFFFCI